MTTDERSAPGIAAFVSPHGFGHAARSSAVLAAAHRAAGVHAHLFTTVPRWFFEESISSFTYHRAVVDVGFRQSSALVVDTRATVEALRDLVPFDASTIRRLADEVLEARCRVVLCDIAPLGVAVAEAAGLPSVLIENFSWPWLYEPLVRHAPGLAKVGAELDRWSARATVHVQTRPVCVRRPDCELVEPVSREVRLGRPATRRNLGIPLDVPLVVVTMGGYGEDMPFLDRLRARADIHFLVTGAERTRAAGNLHLFDNRTALFMPDILHASDAVVAKLGYGTVSEVWRAGLPFAWVTRPDFREMASLEAFAEEELSGFLLSAEHFRSGDWIDDLESLVDMPRRPHSAGGAQRIADILIEHAEGRSARTGGDGRTTNRGVRDHPPRHNPGGSATPIT